VTSYIPPLLVKISPDMTDAEMKDVADVAMQLQIDGIVISNTTIGEREKLIDREKAGEAGGLSGKPLLTKSNATLGKMYQLTKGKIPLVGVGGVSNAADAYEKIRLGASLVQLYSALVFEGPAVPATIKRDLAALVKKDGYNSIEEAVGAAHRPGKR
jgi:dihydroorotate dehydrogenase